MEEQRKRANTGIRREELSVGLARNQKAEQRRLPRWFVNYGGWIFAGVLLLAVLGIFSSVGDRRPRDEATMESPAGLAVVGPLHKVWAEGASNIVKSVQVRVGNTGKSVADDVKVYAAVDNARVQLLGPPRIEPGASELYAGEVRARVRPGQDLQVVLSCSKCR